MAPVPPQLVDRPLAVVPLGTAGSPDATPSEHSPLVLVHDLDGEVESFEPLARALPADLPVVGLRSPLAGPRPERFTSVNTLALRYLADLERAGVTGPLLIAGFADCGVIAVAVARLARRSGVPVGLCAVVDGGPGHLGPGAPAHEPIAGRRSLRPRSLADRARARHLRLLRGRGEPPVYDGVIDLLWASGTASCGPTQGWGPRCAEVRVTRLAADHDHLLVVPGVDEVATVLAGLVEPAGAGSPADAPPA